MSQQLITITLFINGEYLTRTDRPLPEIIEGMRFHYGPECRLVGATEDQVAFETLVKLEFSV